MAEDSLWLQASLHVPDPFGGRDADMEVERRLAAPPSAHRATPSSMSSSQVSSAKMTPPIALAAPSSAASTLKPSRAAAMRASLSMDRPAVGAGVVPLSPVSSQAGGAFLSARSIGDAAAQWNDERDLATVRSQLREAQDEVAKFKSVVASERQTTDAWKARVGDAIKARDEATANERQALTNWEAEKAQRAADRDAFIQRTADADLEWKTKLDTATAKVTHINKLLAESEARVNAMRSEISDLHEQLRGTERKSNDSALQLSLKADDMRRLQEDLDIAHQEAQAAATRHRAQLEQADTQRREELAHMSEEHSRAVLKLQTDCHADIQRVTEECEDRLKTLRQRASAEQESHQLELKRLNSQLAALQQSHEAAKLEFEASLSSTTAALKRQAEAAKAECLETAEADHRAATQRLIDEHCAEVAQLKARLSQNQQVEDRLKRATGELAEVRSALTAAQDSEFKLRAQIQELQRTAAQRASAMEDLTAQVNQTRASREKSTMRHDVELRAERDRIASKNAEHVARLEQIESEREGEEREWTELITDLKARVDAAHEELEACRSAFAKERSQMMKAEADARSAAARAELELDALSTTHRQLQSQLAQVEATAASDSGARLSMSSTLESLRSRLVAAQARIVELEIALDQSTSSRPAAVVALPAQQQAIAAKPPMPLATPRPSPAPQPPVSQITLVASQPSRTAATADEGGNSPVVGAKKASRRRISSEAPTAPPAITQGASRGAAPGSRKTARDDSNDVEPALPPARVPFTDRNMPIEREGKKAAPSLPLAPTSRVAAVDSQLPRVFAVSGFEGNKDLIQRIQSMPSSSVAHCRPNSPVGAEVTHLISSGALTIKVLTAAARGCWVLPQNYVEDSATAGRWLDERDYGFQHAVPPLKGKRIAMTEAFKATRHCGAATLVSKDAGGDVNPLTVDSSEAAVMARAHQLDVLLCSPAELAVATSMCGDRCRALTWDALVKHLYPTAPSTAPSASVAH